MILDTIKLGEDLAKLPLYHRIAFAASCCERLVSNYDAFALATKTGNTEIIHSALETIWAFIAEKNISVFKLNQLVEECEKLVPDSEEFGTVYVGAATNAIIAIIRTLESCRDSKTEGIVNIAQLLLDAIDEYLHIVNVPSVGYAQLSDDFDMWLQQAPLFTSELQKQQKDLIYLESQEKLTSDEINKLRLSSSNIGINPIKRGLLG